MMGYEDGMFPEDPTPSETFAVDPIWKECKNTNPHDEHYWESEAVMYSKLYWLFGIPFRVVRVQVRCPGGE
jgi:hypothetical protein